MPVEVNYTLLCVQLIGTAKSCVTPITSQLLLNYMKLMSNESDTSTQFSAVLLKLYVKSRIFYELISFTYFLYMTTNYYRYSMSIETLTSKNCLMIGFQK